MTVTCLVVLEPHGVRHRRGRARFAESSVRKVSSVHPTPALGCRVLTGLCLYCAVVLEGFCKADIQKVPPLRALERAGWPQGQVSSEEFSEPLAWLPNDSHVSFDHIGMSRPLCRLVVLYIHRTAWHMAIYRFKSTCIWVHR